MSPFNLGGEMIRSVALDRTSWNELPYKFEAGTPRSPSVRPRRRARLPGRDRPRRDRGARARAHRIRWAGSAGSTSCECSGRPSSAGPGSSPSTLPGSTARRGPDPRLGRRRRPRRAPAAQPLMTRLGVAMTTRASFYLYSIPRRSTASSRGCGRSAAAPGIAVSEFDQLYQEVILDHYKNPRGHGLLDAPRRAGGGQNRSAATR